MPLRPADWIVVVAAAALVGALAVASWSPERAAHSAVIHGPGGVQTVSLSTDRRVEVEGLAGISVVEVRAAAGGFAACVPNGVSVQLLGDEAAYDAINY